MYYQPDLQVDGIWGILYRSRGVLIKGSPELTWASFWVGVCMAGGGIGPGAEARGLILSLAFTEALHTWYITLNYPLIA